MKKILSLIAVVTITLLTVFGAQAREQRDPFQKPHEVDRSYCKYAGNPDCLVSFGLSAGASSLEGNGQKEEVWGLLLSPYGGGGRLLINSANHSTWERDGHAAIDMRIPISHSTTISGEVDYLEHVGDLGNTFDNRGFGFNIGFRHYLK